jgi:hypothetical protein
MLGGMPLRMKVTPPSADSAKSCEHERPTGLDRVTLTRANVAASHWRWSPARLSGAISADARSAAGAWGQVVGYTCEVDELGCELGEVVDVGDGRGGAERGADGAAGG